jgi:phospholipid/cholesterol/gamma-HCH transport system permease protein
MNFIQRTGKGTLDTLHRTGHLALFLVRTLILLPLPPFRPGNFLQQVYFIGVRSLFVIILTAAFTGMVLALQGYYTLSRFGSEGLVGPMVALSILQELGPVLSALMVTGRAGSAMAGELGVMRIKEQIDALEVMGINPVKFLVVPRMQATLVAMPVLTLIFDVVGILGGYVVVVYLLGMSGGVYFSSIEAKVAMGDIVTSLVKSVSFGLLVAWVCTYSGFFTRRGAEGIGQAITSAVVLSSVLVLVWDYLITAALL